jgi:hypothetical protein
MPLNNNLFGVYKSIKVNNTTLIASSASRNKNMDVQAENYIQGTPKSRILNIGGVHETIEIEAPVLIGGGSVVDGRNLVNIKINELLNPTTAVLPLLEAATISVSEQGASVNMTLKSDGDPADLNSNVFQVLSVPVAELDPILYTPTRKARFYDFRVNIGSKKYFVMEASIKVTGETTDAYFLIPNGAVIDQTTYTTVGDVSFKAGTQFPFIGITGIKISGSGKAAVLLSDLNSDGDYFDTDESVNINLATGANDMTLQRPGVSVSEDADFVLQIYDGTNWNDLFPSVDLTRSVVHSSNFAVSSGLLTVNFDFTCWVK